MSLLSSLKRALTFNFILVASLPVLIFGLINIDLVSGYQLKGVRERTLKQAESIAGEVETFLLEVNSDLEHVKQTISSREVLRPGSENAFLSGVVQSSRFFESIYLIDKKFHVRNFGVMPELHAHNEDYANLDFSGHSLFRNFNEDTERVWSNTFVSVTTGEPTVSLGMSLPDGFLLGNVHLTSLNDLLQRYANYGDIEVAIVDERGTLVAHSATEKARQRLNYGNHPTISSAMEGHASTQEFSDGSEYYLESAVRVAPAQWVVWVGLDMNKILEPIRNTQHLLVGIMVVAIVLACVIAVLNVRRLMTPLTALGAHAAEIADGNYELRFRSSGFEEIDSLAAKISNMTQAIKVREESIVANEERFRGLVNSIDGIVWEMEYPSFNLVFVSKQAESILGYPVQDWYEIEDFWAQKVYPEDLAQAQSYSRLMTEKRADHSFEFRMMTADDRMVWIRNLVTVVVENDRPVRLLGVMLDISSEKELLEELSRSEENYREIFNATSDAIFIHDADTGKILDVNQAMLNIYNCSYEEALTFGLDTFFSGVAPYNLEGAKAKLALAKEQGRCAFEWQARKASGEVFWVDVSLRSAMIGGDSRILASVRDISARKATERELEAYRSQLEKLVLERTRELEETQKQLVQQERLAVLGQLTATVSHEIRNPLGTVANSLYLLREILDLSGTPGVERPLLLAERNVERCDGIISDLLDFSRQRQIRKVSFDLNQWLSELLVEINLPEDVECQLNLEMKNPLLADSERLRRVMINVLTNAVQALEETEKENKVIKITARDDGWMCEIIVEDNGPGMSDELLAKIFEPMFSTKNFGVGLGVPIIRNIIEGHGGSVTYLSEPGKGTTVHMTLPMSS